MAAAGAEFRVYGKAAEFWDLVDPFGPARAAGQVPLEILMDGPGNTGKTRVGLEACHYAASNCPGARIAIVRKTRVSCTQSWMPIFERHVLGRNHPVLRTGGKASHRSEYSYPNGSVIVPCGLDVGSRLYSSEWDWVYCIELIEFRIEEWEELNRGVRGPTVTGHALFGDTNPGPTSHWLNKRCLEGKTHRIRTRHTDNPAITADELRRLRSLSGNSYRRLYLGDWVASEDLAWEGYDADEHLLSATLREPRHGYEEWTLEVAQPGTPAIEPDPRWVRPIELLWFFGALDFGYEPDPTCFQVWGVDRHRTIYRVAEFYRCRLTYEVMAEWIMELHQKFKLSALVADHDPRGIDYLNSFLGSLGRDGAPLVRKAHKGPGSVEAHLALGAWAWSKSQTTGRARAYLVRDVLEHGACPIRSTGYLPTCFEQEIPDFTLRTTADGRKLNVPDPSCSDHGCSAFMYGLDYAFGRNPIAKRAPDPFMDPGGLAYPTPMAPLWHPGLPG